MKTLNKRSLIILVSVTAFIAVAVTVVWAFMYKSTEIYDNDFTPAQVSCKVVETFDGTKKSSVKIQNTSNIPAYLRLRLVTYWQDTKGNVVQRASVMPSFIVDTANWIDMGSCTYVYKLPVDPNGLTPELLASGSTIVLQKTSETVNGVVYEYEQVVEIIAEAIQSKPVDAVTSSWKVTMDSDGKTIKSAP